MLKKDIAKISELMKEWEYDDLDWDFIEALYSIGYKSGFSEALEDD